MKRAPCTSFLLSPKLSCTNPLITYIENKELKLETKIIQLTEKQNGMVVALLAFGDVGVVTGVSGVAMQRS